MVKFHNISYKNFISAGNRKIEISLEEYKTNLLSGKNGRGKCLRATTTVEIEFSDSETEQLFLNFLHKE